jgi:hypothetical protein
MAAPTLAYTAVAKASQWQMMTDKLWYKFGDQTTKFDAWAVWAAASGSTAQKAAGLKFSGRTIDFTVSNKFITGWPAPVYPTYFQYTSKWSGGCFKDYSSGMGGFCVIEDNDTAFWDCGTIDSTAAAPARGVGTEIDICGPVSYATAGYTNY